MKLSEKGLSCKVEAKHVLGICAAEVSTVEAEEIAVADKISIF